MSYISKLLFVFLFVISLNSIAQENTKYSKVLTLKQLADEMINCKEEDYYLENALIKYDETNENFGIIDSIFVNASVILENLTYLKIDENVESSNHLSFQKCTFTNGISIITKKDEDQSGSSVAFINFSDCKINNLSISLNKYSFLTIFKCEINNVFTIYADNNKHKITIDRCAFNISDGDSVPQIPKEISCVINNDTKLEILAPRHAGVISLNEQSKLTIKNTKFYSDIEHSWLKLKGSPHSIFIDSCNFDIDVSFQALEILNKFNVIQSVFNRNVDIQDVILPGTNLINFRWIQLLNSISIIKLEQRFWINPEIGIVFAFKTITEEIFDGKTIEQAENTFLYYELMATYKTWIDIYKDRGDLQSQNACYIAMKDMETKRLEYLYRTNMNLESYLYWKLNVFLKFFAKYGTSPVQSVIISLWVILAFSVIYFFMYSDWDKIDRGLLISKHSRLLEYFSTEQKLEDFYADHYYSDYEKYKKYKIELENSKADVPILIRLLGKPLYYSSLLKYNFMTWLYKKFEILQGRWNDLTTLKKIHVSIVVGISISLYISYIIIIRILNSIMLSINTFSTLGFGNIPVQGGARYIAILEGFIGWFLLSIFSVALISQILQG